jgi:hypothetical protein
LIRIREYVKEYLPDVPYDFHGAFFAIAVRRGTSDVIHTDWSNARGGSMAYNLTTGSWQNGGYLEVYQCKMKTQTMMGDMIGIQAQRLLHRTTPVKDPEDPDSDRVVFTCFTENTLYAKNFTGPEKEEADEKWKEVIVEQKGYRQSVTDAAEKIKKLTKMIKSMEKAGEGASEKVIEVEKKLEELERKKTAALHMIKRLDKQRSILWWKRNPSIASKKALKVDQKKQEFVLEDGDDDVEDEDFYGCVYSPLKFNDNAMNVD